MEPAISKKYCKTDIWLSCRHITIKTRISFKERMKRGAHLLAPGPACVEGRFVREIMFLLDGISVGGKITREREGVHPYNLCDKAFKSLQMPRQHKIWQHSGDVFACKGCGKKFNPNNSFNRHNKLVCGKPHLNLNMWGEEERKRTVLASSRKRADIIYPLKWQSVVLVFNKFLCVINVYFFTL